ncbi:bile acid:sodium symporter family protein [Alteromonas gracilis]|uniref:bile acid:sodium symporter family protein n=1 Tax=Alteromonas gracilis TaxID=1479524 RepID=UPI003734D4F9
MQASVLTEVLLPLALAFVMFGMGLTLTIGDFTRLLKAPKAVLTGFIGQIVLLPLLALGLCFVFGLPDYIAVGVMILAACPGGTTSNLISHIAKANLALSVSLTAISTIACVFTTPFIIQFAIDYFVKENAPEFSIIQTVTGLVGVSILPVIIGMTIRRFNTTFATKTENFFRQFSMYFMLLMIVGVLVSERNNLASSLEAAFLVCLTLNLSSVLLGLLLAKVSKLAFKDSLTLAIEIGVQNAALAMLICITFLNAPDYAIAPGVYGIAMYIGPALLAVWAKRKNKREQEVQKASKKGQPVKLVQ